MIEIYTDGGVRGNGKKDKDNNPDAIGSYAFLVVMTGEIIFECSGVREKATNNIMEMTAVIEALRFCQRSIWKDDKEIPVDIYSDSQYVVNGITSWVFGWQRRNWISSTGTPVANAALWQEMHALGNDFNVRYQWVRGHADNRYNNRADELCQQALKNLVLKDPL